MNLFTEHPNSINETYIEHAKNALYFAITLAIAAIVCFVHAIFPFMFKKTGSTMITRLYDKMVTNRAKNTIENGN